MLTPTATGTQYLLPSTARRRTDGPLLACAGTRGLLDLFTRHETNVGALLLQNLLLQEPDEGVEVGRAEGGKGRVAAREDGEGLRGRDLREENGQRREGREERGEKCRERREAAEQEERRSANGKTRKSRRDGTHREVSKSACMA